jgi:pimeloyl-ACP methyl ester carboxylesterase
MSGHTETTEMIDGCKVRIMRKGEGAPLLFLHGASGAAVWLPFMDALSKDFDVIVPEHPGFGKSEDPEWLDGIEDLAFFYLDLIAQMGLGNVHVVGTSLGGWIAAEMAVRDCSAFLSLTLVAPAGISVPGVPRGDMFMWSHEETAKNLFHDPAWAARMPAPANDDEMMVSLKNRMTTAKLGWSPRMHNPNLRKWLHRITVPTMILWGDDDKLMPPEYGPAYRDLIPNAKLEIIAACGHLPHVEKQKEFTEKTLSFIRGAA